MIIYESPKSKNIKERMWLGRVLDEKELEEIGLEIQKELKIQTNNGMPMEEIIIKDRVLAQSIEDKNLGSSIKDNFVRMVKNDIIIRFNYPSIIEEGMLKLCSIGFSIEKMAYVVGFNYQQ